MKKLISIMTIVALGGVLFAGQKQTKLITYPAPEAEKMAAVSYSVKVNGKSIDIYKALSPKYNGHEYYFCYFDFEGEVEVEVKSTKQFTQTAGYTEKPRAHAEADKNYVGEIYPYTIKPIVKERHRMVFRQDKPFKAIVLREERGMPLIIFGNPLEKNVPDKNDPNVIYFGPGVHYKNIIELKDNQTLYLAGGAVLKGIIRAKGKNITVRGRGIVSFDNRERFLGSGIGVHESENVKIEGIIVKDPCDWCFLFTNSNNIEMDNVKICGSRMINDDAIAIGNTSNVKIINTFARAQDDIIPVKGYYKRGYKAGLKNPDPVKRESYRPCENIYIDNCILWTDSANIFRLGYECDAPYFKNLVCKNLYIPSFSSVSKLKEYWVRAIFLLQPGNGMPLLDMHFENIDIRADGRDFHLIVAESRIVSCGAVRELDHAGEHGAIKNITFKNINVSGKKRGNWKGTIYINGQTPEASVENLKIENVKYFGEKITEKSPCVIIGKNTKNVSVK